MMHSNGLQVKHLNLSQTKPCLLSFCHIPHILHLCRRKLPSYSACNKFLSLISAELCIQDKGRFTIPNHECDSLWYSNSWRHQVLEGKGFVLKAGVCGGVCAVRDSLLEYSCSFVDCPIRFLDTDLLISWSLLNVCRFIGKMKDILLFSYTLCLFSPSLRLRSLHLEERQNCIGQ